MKLFFLIVLLVAPIYFCLNQISNAQQIVCPLNQVDQLTEATDRNSEDPTINDNGRYVAFRSSADLIGENPSLQTQIYLFDRVARTLVQ